MKTSILSAMGAMLVSAGIAGAQEASTPAEWFSTNVSVTSDYAFRGISQTLEEPALQGGMDLEHPSGLYLGTWGSSVNFGEDLIGGPRAQLELDAYGGYRLSIPEVVDLEVGAIYYMYPGAHGGRNYDFLELGLGASRAAGPVETGLSLSYSPDYFGASGPGLYYGGSLGVPIGLVTLGGSVGHQAIDENDVFGTPDYTDYTLSASVTVLGFGLTAAYTDTDLQAAECFGGSDLCDARMVLSVSR